MSDKTYYEEVEGTEEVAAEIEGQVAAADGETPMTEQAEPAELSLEEQLEAANAEAAKNLDAFLRAQAELSNARKRFEKQRSLAYSNAQADLVSRLLPVLDDFERAMESVPSGIREDSWFGGIELVHRKLQGILESLGVAEIDALGRPFDPNVHDALAQEASEEYESGLVSRVMLKGYQLGDSVIRPALVFVAE